MTHTATAKVRDIKKPAHTPTHRQASPAASQLLHAARTAILGVVFTTLATTAQAEQWEITRDGEFRNEVSTWSRSIPNQQIKAFRGRVDVPHTLLEVLSVLGDIEHYPDWVFQCDSAEHLTALGEDVVYLRIRGIWPVDNRDVVTRSRILQAPDTLTVTIHSWADDTTNHVLPRKTVRMPELENLFILEPLKDGWTRITFQTFVDPGGRIPKWLANFVATRAPLDTLEDLVKQLTLPRHKITTPEQLPFVLPGIDTMIFPKQKPRG